MDKFYYIYRKDKIMDLIVSETPVRTSKNFNINNAKLENISIPKSISKYKNAWEKNLLFLTWKKTINMVQANYYGRVLSKFFICRCSCWKRKKSLKKSISFIIMFIERCTIVVIK